MKDELPISGMLKKSHLRQFVMLNLFSALRRIRRGEQHLVKSIGYETLKQVQGDRNRLFQQPVRNTLVFIFRRKCGFTLLEVLIALAVIGALLVTLISTLNYHLSLVARQETITVATLLAKDKMVALSKSPEENNGFFDSPYDRYSYETFVKDSPYGGIAEIVVVVRSGNDEVTLNEFVFR